MDMKAQGGVKYIGLSTHAPALANKVLDRGILDMMMFSINPMPDSFSMRGNLRSIRR